MTQLTFNKDFFFNIYSTDWSSLVKHVVMIPLQCRALPFIKGISMGFQYRWTLNIPAYVEYSLNQSPYLRKVCLKLETLKINDAMYSKKIINPENRKYKWEICGKEFFVNSESQRTHAKIKLYLQMWNVSSVLITDYQQMMAKSLIIYSPNSYPKPK